MRAALIATVLALWLVPSAWAQTDAFTRLPPREQKIARALFEAQATRRTSAPKSLTLEQIAAKRQQGAGWEDVFREMKAQGLLTQKSLSEVLTSYEKSRRETRIAAAAGER